MESEDQFADSVEEEDEPPMWDMPASEPVAADLSSWSTFNDHQPPPHVTPVPDAWFYLDPQGLQQGPFKSAEMREWFEAGYFKPHLPIRFGLEGDFASLANHFRHGQIPFSTVPSPTTTPGANHQQQLLLQKQQQQQLLEQQQFLANQLQQQRVLEQRRAQEDQQRRALQEQQRVRLEMQQRIQLQEQAGRALQQQQQQQQQFHYQRPQAILPGAAAIGSGWGRPRDNIVPGAGDSMMGGLGMYAAGPPTQAPKPVTTEYAAPSWDEDTTGSSLWNSSVKNDPELLGGAWDKPADEEPSAAASWGGADSSGWSKEKQQQPTTPVVSWNKPQESDGWGGPEPAAPQASPKSSWSKPDVVPQLGSWGRQTSEADVPDVVKEADSTWEATTPNTPSLKQIQQEEQESMRRRLKPSSSSSSSSSSSQQPPPSPTPDQQPHLEDMGQQLKRMLGVSNPSPSKSWGSKTAAAAATPPAPITRSLSLREIQAEEERLAQLKRQEKPVVSSSRWSSVVTGMPPPYSSARPAPVEVKATPPKDRDASFWNFDASAATAASPSSHTPAYNNGSDDLVAWSSKQVKKLGGTEDLTLIQYCATLEDPGEIREYLAAYLGSTPKVSAFATEFIQKKKKHVAGKKQSAADAKATSQQKKKLHH
ncbi:hypothetical protein DYB28_000340 [Aphanomyces astaci]|uniref:GYF domain-containing protein n=1 Tax=Aphanomyces astaci TaxID=112090 RepID=A0A9X8HD79_APHAT|nr:hypothetical protein DYB28_000340 [Aphanomyces astaci]